MIKTPPDVRQPQQARGLRRVSAILDAAAELVAEVGVPGLTVAALAERAQTSKGSMYHFFTDRESVLRALASRHVSALREMVDGIRADSTIDWRALSADAVVDRILGPFRAYTAQHPDLPLILRALATDEGTANARSNVLAAMIDLVSSVLEARHPKTSRKTNARRAMAIVAVIDGMSAASRRLDEPMREIMSKEMRLVLSAYLRSF